MPALAAEALVDEGVHAGHRVVARVVQHRHVETADGAEAVVGELGHA